MQQLMRNAFFREYKVPEYSGFTIGLPSAIIKQICLITMVKLITGTYKSDGKGGW